MPEEVLEGMEALDCRGVRHLHDLHNFVFRSLCLQDNGAL